MDEEELKEAEEARLVKQAEQDTRAHNQAMKDIEIEYEVDFLNNNF